MNALKQLKDKYYNLNRPNRLAVLTISIFIPVVNMFSMVYIVYKLLVKVVPKYRSLNSKVRLGILFGVFIVLFAIGIANPPAEVDTPKPQPEPKEIEQNINDNTAIEEIKVETPEEKKETPEVPTQTLSQKNAIKSAESYVRIGGFSKERLITQLEFEQFSNADAVYAVDNIRVDWNDQAKRSAESYNNIGGFSRGRLIEQLKFEGFTKEQAEYGVNAIGL